MGSIGSSQGGETSHIVFSTAGCSLLQTLHTHTLSFLGKEAATSTSVAPLDNYHLRAESRGAYSKEVVANGESTARFKSHPIPTTLQEILLRYTLSNGRFFHLLLHLRPCLWIFLLKYYPNCMPFLRCVSLFKATNFHMYMHPYFNSMHSG